MKKLMNSFYLLTGFWMLFFAACTSNNYNKETASTEVTVPDTATITMPDTTRQMMTGNGQMMGRDTAGKSSITTPNAIVKGKKGKVSTTMITGPGKNMSMHQGKLGYSSGGEILPMFPGGKNALNDFVRNNIGCPEKANDNGIEGMMTVNFAVDEAGKVSNPRIIGKPLGYGLEEELLEAVNKMPIWTPGVIKGKNV